MKRLFLSLPLLAALVGCAMADMGEESFCFQDTDCYAGQQCSLGQCTWIPDFDLDLEVTPLPSSGYLFQAVEGIDLSRAEPLDVRVAEPLRISLESPVPGTARFTTSANLRKPRSFETVLELEAGDTVARGELELMAGVRDGQSDALLPMAYDLVAEPIAGGCCGGTGECTAPVSQPGVVPSADSTFVLPLDPASPPVILTGQVLVSESNWTPVENLQVQLFEPVTGVRSLATKTDADGNFCLAVVSPPPGSRHRMTLRLGPSESRPTIEIDSVEVGTDDLDLGAIFTGDHGTPVTVTGNTVVGPDQLPVPGVQVSLVGQVDPEGLFRQSVLTDELGRFEARLLAGRYTVQILAPEDSPLASTFVEDFEVSADPAVTPTPLSVQLEHRPLLTGTVMDGESELPVPDVEVVAERLDPLGESMGALTFRTRTDDAGGYELPVDPGSYQMHFRTKSGSGLPWSVGHAATALDADLLLPSIVLEAPAYLSGQVIGERPAPPTEALGGSQVDILGRTPDGRSHLVGSAWADESGFFEAVLPQSLAGNPTP